MPKPAVAENDPIELAEVLTLSKSELIDFELLSVVAQITAIERQMTASDYARVPSLHRFFQTVRAVIADLGYDRESLDDLT